MESGPKPAFLHGHKAFLSKDAFQTVVKEVTSMFPPGPTSSKTKPATPGNYAKPSVEEAMDIDPPEFLDSNGRKLTQEEIDAQSEDDASEDEEDTGDRQEAEAGDDKRKAFLQQGAENILEILKKPSAVPLEIAQIAQETCIVFRQAWVDGPNSESLQRVQESNEKMAAWSQQADKRDQYVLAGSEILHTIYGIHDAMLCYYDQPPPAPWSRSCTLLALSLVKHLDACGLDWKSVVPAELRNSLRTIIDRGRVTSEKNVVDMVEVLVEREMHATRLQVAIMEPALNHVERLIGAYKSKNDQGVKEELQAIEQLNEKLRQANTQAGFKKEDRTFPLKNLQAWIDKKTDSQKLQAYLGIVLEQGSGYHALGGKLTETAGHQPKGKPEDKLLQIARRMQKMYLEPVEGTLTKRAAMPVDSNPASHMGSQQGFVEFDAETHLHQGFPESGSFPLPSIKDGRTEFGKLVSISSLPRGAFRTTVNAGTERCPLLISIPGSNFGRGTIEDIRTKLPHLNAGKLRPLADRRRTHVADIYDIVTIPRSSHDNNRTGIVKFCIRYHEDPEQNPLAKEAPLTEERSRSECIVLIGKMNVENHETRLLRVREKKMFWIVACISRGLNPDTCQPMSSKEMQEVPWLQSMSPLETGAWFAKSLGYEYNPPGLILPAARKKRQPWYLGSNATNSTRLLMQQGEADTPSEGQLLGPEDRGKVHTDGGNASEG